MSLWFVYHGGMRGRRNSSVQPISDAVFAKNP